MRLGPTGKRRRHGAAATTLRNLMRRVAVKAATALEWDVEGFVDADGNTESDKAEVFGAAGVAHRPASGDKAEAILAYLGGDANAPVILVTRNADAIRKLETLEGSIKAGGTYLFSTDAQARIVLEANAAPVNPLAEPTYKADTHDTARKVLDSAIATAAAGVGGAVTSAINAARTAFEASLPASKTGAKIS